MPIEGSTIASNFCIRRTANCSCKHGICFIFLFPKNIYLFWAVLGLHWCAQAYSSCGKWGLLSSCIARVASHCGGFSWSGAQALGRTGFLVVVVHGLSSCGTLAQSPRGVWGLPWPGIKLVSPTLQDGFLTTGPPGKLLPWTWCISSWLLQQSVTSAPYLGLGLLLTAAPADLERGVDPLGPPAPTQPPLLGHGVAPPSCCPSRGWGPPSFCPWPRTWGTSSQPRLCVIAAALSYVNSQSLLKLLVHWFGDAIQPSHPLSSPSPPVLNLSLHQGLLQWVSSSHHVAKVLEFQFQHQSFQRIFITNFL